MGQVEGRTAILIDDMIDTGGTIAGAVRVLKEVGAKDVIIAATHAVFSILLLSVWLIVGCTRGSCHQHPKPPIPEDKRFENLTVLSIAPTTSLARSRKYSTTVRSRTCLTAALSSPRFA